jgi:hypothetical protein
MKKSMDPLTGLPLPQALLFFLIQVWSLLWKGFALWRASKYNQRNWFIVLLVLNTIGILELIYLFRFAKKRLTFKEIKDGFTNTFFTKEVVTKDEPHHKTDK